MDAVYWLIDRLPIPIILHKKNKILHANDAFKKFLTEEQHLENVELMPWLEEIIKNKEHYHLLREGIEGNKEITVAIEGYVKGTLQYWSITSLPVPQDFSDKIRITYLQDISAIQNTKSYWDLHFRVSKATMQLIKEIAERKKLEEKTAQLSNQLIIASRRAGMADVATSVLHNIGNVLNSVKVSVLILQQNFHNLNLKNLSKAISMINDNLDNLEKYFTEDPKGKLIPNYLTSLVKYFTSTHDTLNTEIQNLIKYVQHLEEVVAMQESTSGVVRVSEKLFLAETLNASIQLCGSIFEKNNIEIQKNYGDNLFLISDKFKILQILVNILQNAKDALSSPDLEVPNKIISIKVEKHDNNINILIQDNGIGIESENLTKIFSLGFTTKKTGHGFGLHGSALAAKELGGTLEAISNGIGFGATFILTLPIDKQPLSNPLENKISEKS